MLTHRDSVNFRYILLLNGLAAFVPGMGVQGRARDPLLHATWWTYEQHSAIIAVAVAAILGSVLIGLLMWRNLRRWWVFLFCGKLTGTFPSLFYLVVAPLTREVLIRLLAMLVVGVVWGALMGLITYATVGKPIRGGSPKNRFERIAGLSRKAAGCQGRQRVDPRRTTAPLPVSDSNRNRFEPSGHG